MSCRPLYGRYADEQIKVDQPVQALQAVHHAHSYKGASTAICGARILGCLVQRRVSTVRGAQASLVAYKGVPAAGTATPVDQTHWPCNGAEQLWRDACRSAKQTYRLAFVHYQMVSYQCLLESFKCMRQTVTCPRRPLHTNALADGQPFGDRML